MNDTKGLISHNSVILRNIIFHCIQHNKSISCALVDIKQTEFYPFKGMNGVCAIANSVQEAAEVLRIARSVMYSRNKKLQALGINDMASYEPKEYIGKIWITGREFPENAVIKCRVDGEEKEMTALEIYNYLYE